MGYTHHRVDSYWDWAKAKKKYRVFLKGFPYLSPPDDMLKYQGCVSFDGFGPLDDPPCYSLTFRTRDMYLRRDIAKQLENIKKKLGFLEGPVSAFIYRDYNHLGDGKEWFEKHGKKYDQFKASFRRIPLDVQLVLPSITKDGKRAPNYAFIGRTHRWATDFIFVPQSSAYSNWMVQCYTYCVDEYGRFFPCGCSWQGECEAKPSANNGILDAHSKRTVFYGAYTIDVHHPRIQHLFRQSQFRNYHLNILPMDMDMYSNCRYALVSNNNMYAFDIKLRGGTVFRKGMPGKKRVCEKRGWWIFTRTVCRDEWYPGWDYRTACRAGEVSKFSFKKCHDKNLMCLGESMKIDYNMTFETFPKNGWNHYYHLRHHKLGKDIVHWVLEADNMKAFSHGDGNKVIWSWSFKDIPEEVRVPPLALILTDKGELVLYNGLNKKVVSVTQALTGINVRKDDDGVEDDEDEDYKRMMEALNFDAWRKRQNDAEAALLKDLLNLRDSHRDDMCPAPPFAFI